MATGFLRIVLQSAPGSAGWMQLYFGLVTALMVGAAVLVVLLTSTRSLTRAVITPPEKA